MNIQQSTDNKAAATSIKNVTIAKKLNSVTNDNNKGNNSIGTKTKNEQLKSGYFDFDFDEFQNEIGAHKFINLKNFNKINLHSSSSSLILLNLNNKTVSLNNLTPPLLMTLLRPFNNLRRWNSSPVLETLDVNTEKIIKNDNNTAINDNTNKKKFNFADEIKTISAENNNSALNIKYNKNVSGAQKSHQQLQLRQRQRAQFDQLLNRTGFGCTHYKRRALFVTPCCNKFYNCRFCHDENENHHFDRKTLTELICSECTTRQKVQEQCENCGVRFGKYTCLICNLFDDVDKQQYHCNNCGICRIGGAENFFHCEVCNMCLPIQLKIDGHRCIENMSRSHCPVCLGDIHTSRIPCHIPDCGHLLHKMCFDELLASGLYTCPTCQTSLIDMTNLWDYLDVEATRMPMPRTYENQRMNIFCNDCHKVKKLISSFFK